MRDTPTDALLILLAEERAAIRSGDLAGLPAFADRKAALAEAIAESRPNNAMAARIDTALKRNARLLSAACDGIRAAQARLAALKDVRNGLSLYTAAGDRTTVARRPDSLEHKV